MSRWLIIFSVAFAACVALPNAANATLTVDGNLNDWGITMGNWGHMSYDDAYGAGYQSIQGPGFMSTSGSDPATAPTIGGHTIYFAMEDTNDWDGNYTVGPFSGGQNYDAEFLGVSLNNGILSFAIASGQRQDNWKSNYAPGDLMIHTTEEVVGGSIKRWYGIELGGGEGGYSATNYTNLHTDGTLDGTVNGSTYNLLTSSGSTDSHTSVAGQPVGSIWENSDGDWRRGLPMDSSGNFDGIETQIDGGTQITEGGLGSPAAIAAVAVNFDYDLGQHAWIELQMDTSWLEGQVDSVRWAPSCANDQLCLTVCLPLGKNASVPEPASVMIWGLLSLTAGACVWRRRNSLPKS